MIIRDNGLRYAKLIHVSVGNGKTEQSNKVYIMEEQDDDKIKCTYGRVGGNMVTIFKPTGQWDKLIKEKTSARKGYVDKTEESVTTTSKSGSLKDIEEVEVQKLFDDLMAYANKSIGANYKITQDDVTQKQVDKAQEILDEATKVSRSNSKKDEKIKLINVELIELYMTIPRKMKNVKDCLIEDDKTISEIKNFLANEQSILDTMAGQVKIISQTTSDSDDDETLLTKMGVEMTIETDKESIALVEKLLGQNISKLSNIYKCIHKASQKRFDEHLEQADNKTRRLYWHGTRNQNMFNITQTGLTVRPAGVIHTGSMFGDGLYFANKSQKALGYTSLRGSYWAHGGDNRGYLMLFDVNTGNQKHIKKHTSACYSINQAQLDREGFDTVFAHGGIDLINDEFVAYAPQYCTIAYIIELNA